MLPFVSAQKDINPQILFLSFFIAGRGQAYSRPQRGDR